MRGSSASKKPRAKKASSTKKPRAKKASAAKKPRAKKASVAKKPHVPKPVIIQRLPEKPVARKKLATKGVAKKPRAKKSTAKNPRLNVVVVVQPVTMSESAVKRQLLRSQFKPTNAQHNQVIKLKMEIGTAIEDARYTNRMDEGDVWFYGHNECDLTVERFLEQMHADWNTADKTACHDFEPPQHYIEHLTRVLSTVQEKAAWK